MSTTDLRFDEIKEVRLGLPPDLEEFDSIIVASGKKELEIRIRADGEQSITVKRGQIIVRVVQRMVPADLIGEIS